MGGWNRKDIDEAELGRRYMAGETVPALARAYGVAHATVCRRIWKMGLARKLPLVTVESNGKQRSIYAIWYHMIRRCTDPTDASFANYGGRGVSVCERWLDFMNFDTDMGPRPPRTSLDRIDNNGPYAPWNCRWATSKQQTRNTRANLMLEIDGEVAPAVVWAERVRLSPQVLYKRLAKGWSHRDAVMTPTMPRHVTRRATVAAMGPLRRSAPVNQETAARIFSSYVVGETRQTDLAMEFGVSQTVISRLLRGEYFEQRHAL